MNVLLVDDDPVECQLYSEPILQEGWLVDYAATYQEAEGKALCSRYDVVLLALDSLEACVLNEDTAFLQGQVVVPIQLGSSPRTSKKPG